MNKYATRIIAVIFIIVAFTPFALPVYFLIQQRVIQHNADPYVSPESLFLKQAFLATDAAYNNKNCPILVG